MEILIPFRALCVGVAYYLSKKSHNVAPPFQTKFRMPEA